MSAHIVNELDFFRSVLVRMMMRASGKFAQRIDRAIITTFPAADILSVGFVFDGSFYDTIPFGVFN